MKPQLLFLVLTLSVTSFAQTTDASGKKQGYWKKKDETGNHLLYEGEFKDNKPVGRFKYYYPNDSLRAIMHFQKEGKVAYAQLFHLTGKKMGEGKYVQEIKDSIWIYFDESGILISKDNYVMGKRNGIVKQYLDGKNLRSQTTYVNGELEGKASYFYPNGIEVATGYYKNSLKTGPWIFKEENGKIKEKELYIDGQPASKNETEEFFSKNKTAGSSTGTASTNTLVNESAKGNKTINKDNKGLYNLKNEKKGK
jgi:antitoxin component YwqK of YwqJK toxin-antitoxin module